MVNNKLSKQKNKMTRTTNVAALVRKAMLGLAETKVYSTQAITQTVSNTGVVSNISNGIIEGDDIANRSGTRITVRKLRLYYRCFAVGASQTFRFILFRDLFNQGTTPGVVDLLPAVTWYSQYSDIHQIQQKRFHIIDDWIADSNLTGNLIRSREKNITLQAPIFYNGTTGVAASNGKGAMFLLVIGSSSTGTFDWSVQLDYNDS